MSVSTATRTGRRLASPLARRLAEEAGVTLHGLEGSGPGGRIVRLDVERATAAGSAPETPARPDVGRTAAVTAGPESDGSAAAIIYEPHPTLPTWHASGTGPAFFVEREFDAGALLEFHQRTNAGRDEPVTLGDLVVRAAAHALACNPATNVRLVDGAGPAELASVDVAVTVPVPGGTRTPVLRGIPELTLTAHARRSAALLAACRDRTVAAADLEGAAVTVTDLGPFGARSVCAPVQAPRVLALAVGAVESRPVVEGGQVVVRPRVTCVLSVDGSAVDAVAAARWLDSFGVALRHPEATLV